MSRTWLLVRSDGSPDFRRGDIDIVWENGAPVELTQPEDILNQRLRKTAQTPLGTNLHNKNLGFPALKFLGRKGIGEDTAREGAAALESMVSALIASQKEVVGRIGLDPNEMIDSLEKVEVDIDGTTMSMFPLIKTMGGLKITVPLNKVVDGLP